MLPLVKCRLKNALARYNAVVFCRAGILEPRTNGAGTQFKADFSAGLVYTGMVAGHLLYLVVLEDAPVQVGISELPLSLAARVAADQGGPIHEEQVPHHVLPLPSVAQRAHGCLIFQTKMGEWSRR